MAQYSHMNEYDTEQVRKFITTLFVLRAQRHLRTLATLYGWTPEELAEYEVRFIRPGDMAPVFN